MREFFVSGYIPELVFDVKPTITVLELNQVFQDNLGKNALAKLSTLKLWIDLSNLQRLFLGAELDKRGSFTKEELTGFLANDEGLPEYVLSFFTEYEKESERMKYFPKLLTTYFTEEKKRASGFLRKFLDFEHKLRAIMIGYRSKRLKKDIEHELMFEDDSDPIVRHVLMQKGSPGKFIFPYEFADLEGYIAAAGTNPTKQYLAVSEYRFHFYERDLEDKPFSLEKLLSYYMRLWILEDIFSLKQDVGQTLLENLVEKENAS